ncbi:hypothetical protein TNCV_72081 [Trichonephila clavipes]|nr:hypothetical protein TNCV_72081 [Trichonephila clavipes]
MLKSTYLTLAFRHDLLVDTPLRWIQGIYENSHSPTCDRCTAVENSAVMSTSWPSCNNVPDHKIRIHNCLDIQCKVVLSTAKPFCIFTTWRHDTYKGAIQSSNNLEIQRY